MSYDMKNSLDYFVSLYSTSVGLLKPFTCAGCEMLLTARLLNLMKVPLKNIKCISVYKFVNKLHRIEHECNLCKVSQGEQLPYIAALEEHLLNEKI